MKFINFTYIGRTIKCAKLLTPSNEVVYCLLFIYKHLIYNPSLKWEIIEKVCPKDRKTYKFVHLL